MNPYQPKTEQLPFQKEVLDANWDRESYAWWWEQGLGKSKETIDNAGALYCEGSIDSLFVLAPNGLHRNFVTRELPKHLPDDMMAKARTLFWRGDRAGTNAYKEKARQLIAHRGGLRVLGMSYDGICTAAGKALAKEFLTSARNKGTLYACDESGRIKNPDAERTQVVLASAPYARFRRTLTGTPVSNAPWDVWSQMKFLNADFWKPHGLDSMEAMKATFGEWAKGGKRIPIKQAKGMERRLAAFYRANNIPESQQTTFTMLNASAIMHFPVQARTDAGRPMFKNLAQLRDMLASHRSRVLKADVLKDLPPKLYSTVEFEMAPKQRAAYQSMRDLGFALVDNGQCSASMALTVMLRLQQIACGYLVLDIDGARGDDEPEVMAFEPNPRIELLEEIVEGLDHQAIIWSRFRSDVDQIEAMFRRMGKTSARYDGSLTDDGCAENEDRFHRGEAQFFNATQSKGGEGLTLIEAKTAVYFSNTFNLTQRLQSEDRPHRIGQKNAVNNIDIVASDTIDETLLECHMSKFEMASEIVGDQLRPWLVPAGQLL